MSCEVDPVWAETVAARPASAWPILIPPQTSTSSAQTASTAIVCLCGSAPPADGADTTPSEEKEKK